MCFFNEVQNLKMAFCAREETQIIKSAGVNRRACQCYAEDLQTLKYMNLMRYYKK